MGNTTNFPQMYSKLFDLQAPINNNDILELMKIQGYGSKALQYNTIITIKQSYINFSDTFIL